MRCEEARDYWQNRLDGGSEVPEYEAHLYSCPACRAYVEQITAVVDGLRELRNATEHVGLSSRDIRSPRTRLPRAYRMLRIAAAVAIVATAGFIFVNRSGETARVSNVSVVPDSPDAAPPDASLASGRHGPIAGMTLRGTSEGRFLAVADAHPRGGVQVYWLFPTLDEGSGAKR